MTSTKINQLQLLQQNIQNITLQKQQFETSLSEIDSALAELSSAEKSYKILGKIMISTPKAVLTKELTEKKEILQLRIRNFDKQETLLKQSIEKTQQEVVHELQKKDQKK